MKAVLPSDAAVRVICGTGRFDGASGEGLISAVGSLAPPFDLVGAMSGVISY